MTIFGDFGVRTIINAKGTATRCPGGNLRPEVAAAMTEVSQHFVDMAELQAAASTTIAKVTGVESGYVASGASACIARLPHRRAMKNEVIMVRSQRSF